MFHTCGGHYQRRTSSYFGVNRSKAKVKFGIRVNHCCRIITRFSFVIQWGNFTHVLPHSVGGPLLIFGWKCQSQIWILKSAWFQHHYSITFLTYSINASRWIGHDQRRTFNYFGTKKSKVKLIGLFICCGGICSLSKYRCSFDWTCICDIHICPFSMSWTHACC